jgi:hypothetical protein
MASKLSRIFDFKKVTYDAPAADSDGSFEQDTMFVDIQDCNSKVKEGLATARVSGSLTVFSQMGKLPFGFFNKRINNADHDDTKSFFFFNIDSNPASSPARVQNLIERRVSFIYLYSGQYDPEHGLITSLVIE